MPTEYKYMDRDDSRKTFWGRRCFLIFLVLILICLSIYLFFYLRTRSVDDWILTGQYSKVQERLHNWKWLPLASGRIYEKLGTVELLSKNAAAAEPLFRQADGKIFQRPVSVWPDVLKILWSAGR